MAEFTHATMQKLVELFREPEPDILQGEDLPQSEFELISTRNDLTPTENIQKIPKTIEEFEEQEEREAEQQVIRSDDRKIPEYTMNYQQSVTAEDVFLQIGPKTTGSASCENLVVTIKMTGDKKENVDLTVNTNSITVISSRYALKLPLPHGINPDLSKANWDSEKATLVLTLKLDREFDFVNF